MNKSKSLLLSLLFLTPAIAMAEQVTCESKDNKRVECNMNTRGVVVVVKQLSKTTCVENKNWGLNKSSIWVSDGCRAVFALEGAASTAKSGAPDAAIRGCNKFAANGYDGTIESQSALKPGYWEVILRFEEYRYVCNVNDKGEVSEFNKLN